MLCVNLNLITGHHNPPSMVQYKDKIAEGAASNNLSQLFQHVDSRSDVKAKL